jgi:hypothetical protein
MLGGTAEEFATFSCGDIARNARLMQAIGGETE